ncbi:MAG: DUF3987 domain-containing protein [Planctomycetia bacterium]|jgi:hypothetical protein
MQPIEKILSRLPDHRATADGFKARCPAHEDLNPSLSIREAQDGVVLVKCFAGCPPEKVVSDLGLRMADLFPSRDEPPWPSRQYQSSRPEPRHFATAEDAINGYGRGTPDRQWTYVDASGTEIGRTLRWNMAKGKDIRPVARFPDGWRHAAMKEPRPLFNLPALLANQESPIYVVEGEKCVDALTALGLLATTSAGGSQAAQLTDWALLAGRLVVILPDNDAAGRKYAETVADILDGLGATVVVVFLDGLAAGGDVADLLERCTDDAARNALREQIEAHASRTQAMPAEGGSTHFSGLEYQPFPVDTLPDAVAAFVSESAAAVRCDEAFVALPVLTLLGAAVGNTRRLRLKRTYEAPTILWTGIIGESGTGKTPAIRTALASAYAHEQALRQQDPPRRLVVGDATTEALAHLMASNARGIFCVRDELAGWFGSIDRYTDRRGGCSADRSFLLSAYDGVPDSVDRRTGDRRSLHIPRISLWVTGGIQPGILARAMGTVEREAGLLSRLLLACPPSRPQVYSDDDVSETTQERFDDVLKNLFAIEGEEVVTLSADAKHLWRAFHDRTAAETNRLAGDLAAAWSKFRGTALRIALILHLAESSTDVVPLPTMERAIVLTEWFKQETRRVYSILAEAPQRQADRTEEDALLAWMARRGWVTQRDIERGSRCFRAAGRATTVIRRLVTAGRLEQQQRRPGPEGGSFTTVYRLAAAHSPAGNQPKTQLPPDKPPTCGDTAPPTEEDPWTKL